MRVSLPDALLVPGLVCLDLALVSLLHAVFARERKAPSVQATLDHGHVIGPGATTWRGGRFTPPVVSASHLLLSGRPAVVNGRSSEGRRSGIARGRTATRMENGDRWSRGKRKSGRRGSHSGKHDHNCIKTTAPDDGS